jgi:hypothetical protein
MVMSMTVIGFTTITAAIQAATAEAFRQRAIRAIEIAYPKNDGAAAFAMGVSAKHFSDWKRGLRPMSAERFEALSKEFHDAYDTLKATERGWLLVAEPHLMRLLEGIDRLVMAKCEIPGPGSAYDQMINPGSQKAAS